MLALSLLDPEHALIQDLLDGTCDWGLLHDSHNSIAEFNGMAKCNHDQCLHWQLLFCCR